MTTSPNLDKIVFSARLHVSLIEINLRSISKFYEKIKGLQSSDSVGRVHLEEIEMCKRKIKSHRLLVKSEIEKASKEFEVLHWNDFEELCRPMNNYVLSFSMGGLQVEVDCQQAAKFRYFDGEWQFYL